MSEFGRTINGATGDHTKRLSDMDFFKEECDVALYLVLDYLVPG